MSAERTPEGWVLSVRPSGFGRWFSALFLTFWLCGWAVGESVVLGVLGGGAWAIVSGMPFQGQTGRASVGALLATGAFLLVWLSLWTLGGIAAIHEWLRLISSEERLTVTPDRVLIARRRGPWTFRSEIARADVRRVHVTYPRRQLAIDTTRKSIEFAPIPAPGEVEAAVVELTRELGLEGKTESGEALPEGWDESISPEGDRIVTTHAAFRRRAAAYAAGIAVFAWIAALVMAWSAMQSTSSVGGAIASVVVAAAFAAIAWWLHRRQDEMVVGGGRLVWRRRSGTSSKDLFVAERLELAIKTDSDGDVWFRLYGVAAPGDDARTRSGKPRERTIVQLMNDPFVPTALGEWLARHAGVPFHRPTTHR